MPQKNGECLSSPVFAEKSSEKIIHWQVQLYLRGANNESKDYISVFVRQLGQDNMQTKFKITLLNGNKKQVLVSFPLIEPKLFPKASGGWGRNLFIEYDSLFIEYDSLFKEQMFNFMPADELNIKCEVQYVDNHTSATGSSQLMSISSSGVGNWLDHFKQLMDQGTLSFRCKAPTLMPTNLY